MLSTPFTSVQVELWHFATIKACINCNSVKGWAWCLIYSTVLLHLSTSVGDVLSSVVCPLIIDATWHGAVHLTALDSSYGMCWVMCVGFPIPKVGPSVTNDRPWKLPTYDAFAVLKTVICGMAAMLLQIGRQHSLPSGIVLENLALGMGAIPWYGITWAAGSRGNLKPNGGSWHFPQKWHRCDKWKSSVQIFTF